MPKLPIVRAKEIERILRKLGFIERNGKGSHKVYKHPDGRRTVIAFHNRPISVRTLRAILRQIELSVDDFLDLIKSV